MSLAYPKPERLESPAYLKYVRQHPCLIPKCWKVTQAHHLVFDGQGRIGSKVSDFQTVPLCAQHHRQFHQLGREKFAGLYALDFARIIIDLLSAYIVETK